jgi:hypothetical protein
VPSNLLAAARDAAAAADAQRWDAEAAAAAARARRADAAAAVFERAAAARAGLLAARALASWRASALEARVFLLHESLAAGAAEAERRERGRQLQAAALEAYLARRLPPPPGAARAAAAAAALLAWRAGASRARGARESWAALVDAAAGAAGGGGGGGACTTYAARLVRRRARPEAGVAWAAGAGRLQGYALAGWRALAQQAAVWRGLRQVGSIQAGGGGFAAAESNPSSCSPAWSLSPSTLPPQRRKCSSRRSAPACPRGCAASATAGVPSARGLRGGCMPAARRGGGRTAAAATTAA